MESRLTLLAALSVLLSTRLAAADTNKKDLARELFDLGVEEYKTKQYDAAAASMGKSYALDPVPSALYAMAQAERLAGKCKEADVHYRQMLDLAKDEQTITAVKANLELCKQIESGEEPKAAPVDAKVAEQRDAPTIQIRTVYRTERHTDGIAIAMYAIGGTALGGAVTTYLLAKSTQNEEATASSLAQYNDLYDRANRLRWTSYAAAGVGAVLVGYATVRLIRGSGNTRVKEVAVVPISGGSMVAWSSTW